MWSQAANLLNSAFLLAQADPVVPGSAAAQAAGAAADGAAPAASGGMFLEQMIPLALIVVVMWLFLIRPQQKRAKEHKTFVETLKVGATVVTNSGIFGKVRAIDGKEIKMEIADKVVIRVLKSQVAGLEANADEAVDSGGKR